MILCCGEALIDFMPVESADGALAFQPFNGGSIYNVAIALGRLGQSAGFFGGLSEDFFGEMLGNELANSSVDISLSIKSGRATTLAFVKFNDGQPDYAFLDEVSAGRMLNDDQIPNLPDEVDLLHFGSISLISNPAASMFEQLAAREKGRRLISIDPNIRPSLVNDESDYRARLERMFSIADIIKVSDEDLEWLYPGIELEDCALRWLNGGARLVVITQGAKGAIAYAGDSIVEQAIESVDVVDTVGAGDTFMAGLLAALGESGNLSSSKLNAINQAALINALSFATRAAAITVSRKGANPPWKEALLSAVIMAEIHKSI